MCGILGVIRPKGIEEEHIEIFKTIFKESESRGKDAFGFYAYPKNILYKQKGKVTTFLDKFNPDKMLIGNSALLAHTRATTTGTENKNQNNHPFQTKDFILAHNGCIWNHHSVRANLKKTDIETDSIVILKLIQDEYNKNKDISLAIAKMAKRLTGNYACWLMFKKTGSVYLFRHNNPLYLSYNQDKEMYAFASEREFLSFLEGDIKGAKGFKGGLAFAEIDEDVIYRLTKTGLDVMDKFEGDDGYQYTNFWDKDSKVISGKFKENVKDKVSLIRELWNTHDISIEIIEHNFRNWGIFLRLGEEQCEVVIEDNMFTLLKEPFNEAGFTLSPFTRSFRVEYKDSIETIFKICDIIERGV